MNNKIIGIVCRPNESISNKKLFSVSEEFKNIVWDHNCIPIGIIPNIKNISNKLNKKDILDFENILKICNGFILQGGEDYYDYDRIVIKYAIKNDIPILGICLGCQTMASLYQDNLKIIDNNTYINHNLKSKEYVHDIIINPNSMLYKIIGKSKIKVNSTHNEHIIDTGIYTASSFSTDGIIESIEYPKNKFNVGLQFHPERLTNDKIVNKIFENFFEIIKNN